MAKDNFKNINFHSIERENNLLNLSSVASSFHEKNNFEGRNFLLIRYNNWNDYDFYTRFRLYELTFYEDKKAIFEIGEIRIIQPEDLGLKTNLPSTFKRLDKNKFFSRGYGNLYYKNLKELYSEGERTFILESLNDVYISRKSRKLIISTNPNLKNPLDYSLFRNNELNSDSEYYDVSKESLNSIKELLEEDKLLFERKKQTDKTMINMCYVSLIITLETFLGDLFKENILDEKGKYYLRYINKFNAKREFAIEKFAELDPMLIAQEEIKKILFHRIDSVISLFNKIFELDFKDILTQFRVPIDIRHDIVHRNGVNEIGKEILISKEDFYELYEDISEAIDYIYQNVQMKNKEFN